MPSVTIKKLGIIAGGGRMPALLVESCRASGRNFFVLALEDHTDMVLGDIPHKIVRLGAIGEALRTLKKEKVEEVILAGHVGRPTLASLRPDMTATLWLAKLGSGIFSGDDALLSAIVTIMEEENFHVVGMQEVLAHLLTPEGTLGKHKPGKKQMEDIARGMQVVKTLGDLDIGQAAIVENGYVLGVEAAEGTEALVARCGALPQHEQGNGVLVKAKKPKQDIRADLPTIGTDTVEQAHAAGLAGIAVEAGGSIILDLADVIALADRYKLFILGARHADE
ncbi:MAG: UDP-2,3-diacylglucosamine diphosphatase LpxI [Alphaproteobacteria bacterium]|nr:UDP-2,3-diacylglucosamine diphosphatase LpxI [Alphaproteobacteria bacterium]